MQKPWLVRAFSKALTLARSHSRLFSSQPSSFVVKKITRENFDSALLDLRRHVQAADFISIDLEMTGVTSAPWRESFEYDRFDIRYLKVKDSAEKFAVVQFGVCPFRWDNSRETFIAHPHNFYIFPRKELPVDVPSFEFLCQTTSIDFLAKHQFDFNACIHEGSIPLFCSTLEPSSTYSAQAFTGISYLSRVQEAEALHRLDLTYDDGFGNSGNYPRETGDIPLVSFSDVLFSERMKNRFCEWRDGLLRNPNIGSQLQGNSDACNTQFQTVFFKMRPSLVLDRINSHQLRLVRQVIRKNFKDLTYVCTNGEDSYEQNLVVYTDSEDDKALLMKEVRKELHTAAKMEVEAAVGFRHVIDLLTSEKKLIVGHNCLLDFAHIYSKFFGALPSTVSEFASSLHDNFPYIIDTKHLLRADHGIQRLMKKKSTSLSSAFALLCAQITSSNSYVPTSCLRVKVEVEADEMGSSNWNSGAKHEAGYDAFMTGCVFAQCCYHLGIDFKHQLPSTELAKNGRLQKHTNLLFLGWNCGSIIDLTTGNEILDPGFQNHKQRFPKIVFENTVLVWGFQAKFKPKDLRDSICHVFGTGSVTSIYYLDETSAFVQFSKKEFANDFLRLKDMLEKSCDPLSVLHPLEKLLEGGNTRAANYSVYEQICSSPMSRFLFSDQAEAVGVRWKTKLELEEESESKEQETSEGSTIGNHGRDSVGESVTCRKKEMLEGPHYRFPGEKILDALYAANSLLAKRSRTT